MKLAKLTPHGKVRHVDGNKTLLAPVQKISEEDLDFLIDFRLKIYRLFLAEHKIKCELVPKEYTDFYPHLNSFLAQHLQKSRRKGIIEACANMGPKCVSSSMIRRLPEELKRARKIIR